MLVDIFLFGYDDTTVLFQLKKGIPRL